MPQFAPFVVGLKLFTKPKFSLDYLYMPCNTCCWGAT